MSEIVVCVSTALEGDGLPASAGGTPLVLVRTGVGTVNAAAALTRCLGRLRPRAVIACGVGGAYAPSGLSVGDVVCAGSETYADLGADSFNQWAVAFAKKLFPDRALENLSPQHPVYSINFNLPTPRVRLQGVSNGTRLLMIHSPTDLSSAWQQRSAGPSSASRRTWLHSLAKL